MNGKALTVDELCVQTQYTFKSTDTVMGPSGAKAVSGDNLVIIKDNIGNVTSGNFKYSHLFDSEKLKLGVE